MGNTPFRALAEVLDKTRPVLVQAHDFPDHDAIASAYALCELLLRAGYTADMTFAGEIQSISLSIMMDRLSIQHLPFDEALELPGAQTIVVDGSPFDGTVRRAAGELVAVIDHHPVTGTPVCPLVDIRPDTGSCSSIIWTYWLDSGEEADRTTATALIAGIQLDTDFLSRHVSKTDLDAHYELFFMGNYELAREVVRTTLKLDQVRAIGKAFTSSQALGSTLLVELKEDYSSELLSVLADFLLRLQEITFVVAVEIRGEEYHLSARSKDCALDAGSIIRAALDGIGTGGGHRHMAGGIITPAKYPGSKLLLERITRELDTYRSEHEADSKTCGT